MSNFTTKVIDRETGVESWAIAMDDYFGRHHYGVAIPPANLYPMSKVEMLELLSDANVYKTASRDFVVYDVDEFTEKSRYAFVADKD